ncbi:MAG TPA: alpha/beta hydrolase [Dongiaceae bacterium]|nr:alpha/beta hydrolase [Dongiaceae bacterium]
MSLSSASATAETAFWDDAYSNSAYIPDGGAFPAKWAVDAVAFRTAMTAAGRAKLDQPYGSKPRERFDLFLPAHAPEEVLIFVHGGYWMAFDKSSWSHLAAGALARGWAVAMPGYTLCPEVRISGITAEVAQAVAVIAEAIPGDLVLAGHSAGGHLVTRLACADGPLPAAIRARVRHTVSISGVHDLRPLLKTTMNETLRMDAAEAARESPALLMPVPGAKVTCWAGSRERPEFIRQNALLANIWAGLGARTAEREAKDRHHYDVIEDLTDPGSALVGELLDA